VKNDGRLESATIIDGTVRCRTSIATLAAHPCGSVASCAQCRIHGTAVQVSAPPFDEADPERITPNLDRRSGGGPRLTPGSPCGLHDASATHEGPPD